MQETGDPAQFLAQAMDACGDAVYRLALCRLGSRADAEDVFQDVFYGFLTGNAPRIFKTKNI